MDQNVVSTIESYKYPIYGVQYHPEVILYKHGPMIGLIRDKASRLLTEDLSFFFVGETRKNFHKYPNYEAEIADDIYNMNL